MSKIIIIMCIVPVVYLLIGAFLTLMAGAEGKIEFDTIYKWPAKLLAICKG